MFEFDDFAERGENQEGPVASIKVVGVGGAGGNVINNMISANIKAVQYIAMNTDLQVLESSMASVKLQIGKATTRGLGAGSKPEVGRESALEDREEIAEHLRDADMVFITCGMGGGTGTGAAPVVAEIARSMGALTIAVVTRPFFYEGGKRKRNAKDGIDALEPHVDTLIVIPNDRIGLVTERGTPLLESFSVANDVLRNAVKGITDLIVMPGLINLDFADVKTVMEGAGRSVIGMGVGTGAEAAHEAAKRAIVNPLLENTSVDGASGILINITGGLNLSLDDVEAATGPVYDSAAEDANILMGTVIDPDIKDEVRVTIIATGFKDEAEVKVELPKAVRKWETRPRPKPIRLRASERVLAKTLHGVNMDDFVAGMDDPLDIPTFLRKPEPQGAGSVIQEMMELDGGPDAAQAQGS